MLHEDKDLPEVLPRWLVLGVEYLLDNETNYQFMAYNRIQTLALNVPNYEWRIIFVGLNPTDIAIAMIAGELGVRFVRCHLVEDPISVLTELFQTATIVYAPKFTKALGLQPRLRSPPSASWLHNYLLSLADSGMPYEEQTYLKLLSK